MNKLREIYLYYCERCKTVTARDERLNSKKGTPYYPCGVCTGYQPHRAVAIDFKARIFCTPVSSGQ